MTLSDSWKEENNMLMNTFVFDSFSDAITWMFSCSLEIDPLNHHPEWKNVYNKVAVRLTTHDAGNVVTDKDRELAELMNEHYQLFLEKGKQDSDTETREDTR